MKHVLLGFRFTWLHFMDLLIGWIVGAYLSKAGQSTIQQSSSSSPSTPRPNLFNCGLRGILEARVHSKEHYIWLFVDRFEESLGGRDD